MSDELKRITVSLYPAHLAIVERVQERYRMNASAALRFILDEYQTQKDQLPLPFAAPQEKQ